MRSVETNLTATYSEIRHITPQISAANPHPIMIKTSPPLPLSILDIRNLIFPPAITIINIANTIGPESGTRMFFNIFDFQISQSTSRGKNTTKTTTTAGMPAINPIRNAHPPAPALAAKIGNTKISKLNNILIASIFTPPSSTGSPPARGRQPSAAHRRRRRWRGGQSCRWRSSRWRRPRNRPPSPMGAFRPRRSP